MSSAREGLRCVEVAHAELGDIDRDLLEAVLKSAVVRLAFDLCYLLDGPDRRA
jgi:hypothetical protein